MDGLSDAPRGRCGSSGVDCPLAHLLLDSLHHRAYRGGAVTEWVAKRRGGAMHACSNSVGGSGLGHAVRQPGMRAEHSLRTADAPAVQRGAACCSACCGDSGATAARRRCRAGQTIVFADTKSDVDATAQELAQTILAKALHGDIAQAQREVTLKAFKAGSFSVLVATDVAARGLDISSASPPHTLPPAAALPP